MLPSNMEIEVGVVNGYNNLIQIATDDMQLGFNASVNELRVLLAKILKLLANQRTSKVTKGSQIQQSSQTQKQSNSTN